MPNNIMMADVNFPDLSGKSQKEQISTITNYLFMLLEQLRYVLNNLGISNFNESELDGMQKQFTGPIQIKVTDMEGNISTLFADVDQIVNQVEDVEGNYSSLQIQVKGISSTVSNLNGQFSQVKQDVDGLQVYTQGGVTYISGSHVKSGTIEGSVLKCSLNSSQGASDGEIRFYYNVPLGIYTVIRLIRETHAARFFHSLNYHRQVATRTRDIFKHDALCHVARV